MKKRKVKRYEEGGKTEADYKREGLAASKGDKVGFFERLRMGNIDSPGSEAYYKFGAGRGKMIEESTKPVPEMSSDYSGRRTTTLSDTKEATKPKEVSETMDLTERLRTASPGSNVRRMDGSGGYTSPVTEEVKEELKVKPKPKKSKLQRQNEMARRMARGYEKASASDKGSLDWTKTGSGSSGFPVREDLEYTTKTGTGASGFKKGGKVSSASSRADGIAQRGKTRGRVC